MVQCPYCKGVMAIGYVENSGEVLCWIPEGESKGITRWSRSPNGVRLAKYNMFTGSKAKAHYCRDCQKIVIDLYETER